MKDGPPLTRVDAVYENMDMRAFHMFREEVMNGKGEKHAIDFRIVDKTPNAFNGVDIVVYCAMKMPLMSERDSLFSWKQIVYENGNELHVICSIDHKDFPVTPKRIRMDAFEATLCEFDGKNLKLTEIS